MRQRYVWDAENRLRAVTPVSPDAGDLQAEFAYDYLGRRTVQTVSSWTGSAWTVVSETKYVWAGWLMLMELDGLSDCSTPGAPTECVVRKYTWGLDLAGQTGNVNSVESAGGIGGLLAVSDANGTPANPNDDLAYVYFYDANGNVGQVFDPATQTVVAHYEYDPYGNVTNDLSGYAYAETNRWRFSTHQYDPATGLVYAKGRYYDAVLGRWLNRDPFGEEGAMLLRAVPAGGRFIPRAPRWGASESQLYSFCSNAPVIYIDAFGLQSSQPSTQPGDPTFPGEGTEGDPRDITSIYDFLLNTGDPGCGVCFRINPRGDASKFSMKVIVLRVDPGCPKSKEDLEKKLAGLGDLSKMLFWVFGYEEKCKADRKRPPHSEHKKCKCECVNKKKLPRMFYKFEKTFRNAYLEYSLIPPGPVDGGCTGDFKLSADLEMDGWYGQCRAKCRTGAPKK